MTNEAKTKRRKKKPGSLLMEPSIEEERFAESLVASNSGASAKAARTGDNDDNHFSLHVAKKQSKSSTHVISSAQDKSERAGRCAARDESKRRASSSRLGSLLSLLFGLQMMLAVIAAANLVSPPAAQASTLFNSTPATSVPKQARLNSSATPSGNETLAFTRTSTTLPDTVSTTTAAASSDQPEAEEDIEEGSENSLGAENEAAGASPEAGRSGANALLLDTASEAADQLISRLRADTTDNEPAVETDKVLAGDQERRIERRDQAESERLGAKAMRSIESAANLTSAASRASAEELQFAMETYAKWRETSNEILELLSRKVLPIVVEHGYDVDAVTVTGLLQLFNGIRAFKPWALRVLDASAKLTPGLLVGTQSDFGDFDECLNVRVDDPSGVHQNVPLAEQEVDPQTGLPSSTVIGRYCLADVEFPKPPRVRLPARNEELQSDFEPIELRNPLLNFSRIEDYKDTIFVETANFFHMLYVDPIRVGICLTNKIDPDNFATVLNKLTKPLEVSIHFRGRCVTKYDRPVWTGYQKLSAYVLVIACSLVVLCTLMDLLHAKLNKLPLPFGLNKHRLKLRNSLTRYRALFTSFSLIRNTKRLFKPQSSRLPAREDPVCKQQQYSLNLQHSMARCSTSAGYSPTSSSSSEESSPSIERRSSVGSSGLNLISADSSSLATSTLADNKLLMGGPLPVLGQQRQQTDGNNLLCLHGIRVITMIWMIVNHTYLFGGFFVLWAHRRLIDIAEWPKSISFQLVLNGWLTVETYFFLSATIIVLNVMPLMKRKRFAYLPYILHRLLRLLPAYTGLVCLNFLWPLISSGPVWLVKGKSFIQTPCENYLWTNFLFINNWIWPEKQCMVHTWFLSADFQLYLVAPIIVYLLYRRPLFGHSLNLIVALIASLLSGLVIYANKLMPSTLINKLEFDSIKQQLSYSYFATYQHMGPYCLGIFIGYLLHRRDHINLPRHITWLLWLLLPPLSFTTLLLTYLWNGAYDDLAMINPSPLVSAFYVAIHRTIWTSLLAWIVFACATGRARLMSSFLSHSIFVPISRLSFSIYLVHLPVIMFRALNLRHTIEWTDSNILWEACGNFIVSLVFGYFLNVAFESPIINLERVVFGRGGGINTSATASHSFKPNAGDKSTIAHLDTTDSTSDDDDKSAKSGQSSQIAPKMSDSSVTTNLSSSQETSPRELHWSEYSSGQQERKSLKPKQNSSVEEIFGSQMEPLSLSKTALVSVGSGSLELAPHRAIYQQQQMAPPADKDDSETERRYSSYDSPARLMTEAISLSTHNNDSLTSGLSFLDDQHVHEQQYRARAGHLLRPKFNYSRSSQYATLARSSRFEQRDQLVSALDRFEYPTNRLSQLFATPARPKSHLGADLGEQDEPSQSGRLMKHRAQQLFQRRQGQYNTLTGVGVQEWRKRYTAEASDPNWRIQRWNGLNPTDRNFLQPGTMIPRIDSSTLRRHSNKKPEPTSSIEEEPPAFEEREDAVL